MLWLNIEDTLVIVERILVNREIKLFIFGSNLATLEVYWMTIEVNWMNIERTLGIIELSWTTVELFLATLELSLGKNRTHLSAQRKDFGDL